MSTGGIARRHGALLGWSQQVLDILVIWCTLLLSTNVIGLGWQDIFTFAALLASLLFWILGRQNHLYGSWRTQSFTAEVQQVLSLWFGVAICLLLLAYALTVSQAYSRWALVAWVLVAPFALCLLRAVVRGLLRSMRASGRNFRRVAIAGAGRLGQDLARTFSSNQWMGLHVSGAYDNEGMSAADAATTGLRYLGDLEQLLVDARSGHFDEIYIALPMTAAEDIRTTIDGLADCSVQVSLVPDILIFKLVNSRTRDLGGLPVISVYDSPLDENGQLLKRLEDVVVSTVVLMIIALPMLLIALAIKITSPCPVIFRQCRAGLSA